MNRSGAAAGILLLVLFADEFLRLWTEGIAVPDLIGLLSLLTALAFLFLRTIDWARCEPLSRSAVTVALALFGLHPVTLAALSRGGDGKLTAALSGIAAGIVICRWQTPHRWQFRLSLMTAVLCTLLDAAGAAFAPLLAASVWLSPGQGEPRGARRFVALYWPALAASALAAALHAKDFQPSAAIALFPGLLAGFFAPSLQAGWTSADGFFSIAAVAAAIPACALYFRLPAAAFGLSWFLLLGLIAPSRPFAALPGLALALVSVFAAGLTHFLRNRPAWSQTWDAAPPRMGGEI